MIAAISTISSILCFLCAGMSICMSIKLIRRSRELKKVTKRLEKLEHYYIGMAQELQNMTDAVMLGDGPGLVIFYQKLIDLHKQFMSVGVDD
jgi:hypothetical protein